MIFKNKKQLLPPRELLGSAAAASFRVTAAAAAIGLLLCLTQIRLSKEGGTVRIEARAWCSLARSLARSCSK